MVRFAGEGRVNRIRLILIVVTVSLPGRHLALCQQAIASRDSAEMQSYNSSQYHQYIGQMSINQLIHLPSSKTKPSLSLVAAPKTSLICSTCPEKGREAYLLLPAANSDLVIIGTPHKCDSAATSDGQFIFSDYVTSVDRVYGNRGLAVIPGQTIVVGRPGGIISVEGKQILGSVYGYPLFHLGEPYLMFLKFMPATGGFLVVGEAAFNVSGENVPVHLTRTSGAESHLTATLLEDATKAVSKTFGGESK